MRDLVKPTKYGQLLLLNKLDRLFLDSDPIMQVPVACCELLSGPNRYCLADNVPIEHRQHHFVK